MKKHFFITVFFLLFSIAGFSQANCSNPVHVTICPDSTLMYQTNAGMGDDAPSWCNITGEDLLYRIIVPATTLNIFVSFANLTHSVNTVLMKDSCTNSSGSSHTFYGGTPAYTFAVSGSSNYFLWVDCSVSVWFTISFGADTASAYINHPNTLGNFQFDTSGCAAPLFSPSKPFFQVKYNGVYQTNPMTLSPLGIAGTLCLKTFLQNTTGDAGIRTITFDFGSDFTLVQAPDTITGFYNSGYWLRTGFGNFLVYNFFDSLSLGRGDFDGSPNSCLGYEFYFDLIPYSNNPGTTNVDVLIFSDGYGTAFSGTVNSGCCPGLSPGCHFFSGGSAAGVNGFGYGMNDPGGSLPVELLTFEALPEDQSVRLFWATASEINNDYFSIERSSNGINWVEINKMKGAGNSTSYLSYENTDTHPLNGLSYYRLKQTDYNGALKYSETRSVRLNIAKQYEVFPNPASSQIIILRKSENSFHVSCFTTMGQEIIIPKTALEKTEILNTSELPNGQYYLVIRENDGLVKTEIITILHP